VTLTRVLSAALLAAVLAASGPASGPHAEVGRQADQRGSLIPLEATPDAEVATARRWRELGTLGFVVAGLVMIAAAFLPVPMEVPAVINGIAFGAVTGSIITWTGGFLGAILSYELALRLGRAIAGRRFAAKAQAAGERVLSSGGGASLVFLRLMPLVAFHALNWGAGLARVRRSRFYWTTAIGIAPACIVLSASGTFMAAAVRRYLWPSLVTMGVLTALAVGYAIVQARRERVGADVPTTGVG
jgi:uncharacterized membrane protein YdjX (TVP38/TMEM64 family)